MLVNLCVSLKPLKLNDYYVIYAFFFFNYALFDIFSVLKV